MPAHFRLLSYPQVVVTTASIPGGSTSTAYSQQFTASGGTPPYTWSIVGGSLPPGLSLSSTGLLSGTPTQAGTFAFTVQAQDTVVPPPLPLLTEGLLSLLTESGLALTTEQQGTVTNPNCGSKSFSVTMSGLSNVWFGATLPTLPTQLSTTSSPPLAANTNRGSYYTPGVGGDAGLTLQAALNAAAAATGTKGDVIVLQSSTTYTTASQSFVLPARTGSGWIYVITNTAPELSGIGLPAAGTRASPANIPAMASLRSSATNTGGNLIVRSSGAGVSQYRLVGLDLQLTEANAQAGNVLFYVVLFNNLDTSTATLCSNITLDRCYIAGGPTSGCQHAVGDDGNFMEVTECYIERVHQIGIGDTNCIVAVNSTGPYRWHNNYLDSQGQGTFFGGSDTTLPSPSMPSDIAITNNYFFKNFFSATGTVANTSTTLTINSVQSGIITPGMAVLAASGFIPKPGGTFTQIVRQLTGTPGGAGTYQMTQAATGTSSAPETITGQPFGKNAVEFKVGQRVLFDSNYLENAGAPIQPRTAFVLTSRNQSGGNPWYGLFDFTISNNVFTNCQLGGINVLLQDNNNTAANRILFRNNLFILSKTDGTSGTCSGFVSSNSPTQGGAGAGSNIIFDHNSFMAIAGQSSSMIFCGQGAPIHMSLTNMVWSNNIFDNSAQGLTDAGGGVGYANVVPRQSTPVTWIGNVHIAGNIDHTLPAGNFTAVSQAATGFVNYGGSVTAAAGYALTSSSPYHAVGVSGLNQAANTVGTPDGTDIGCNVAALPVKQTGASTPNFLIRQDGQSQVINGVTVPAYMTFAAAVAAGKVVGGNIGEVQANTAGTLQTFTTPANTNWSDWMGLNFSAGSPFTLRGRAGDTFRIIATNAYAFNCTGQTTAGTFPSPNSSSYVILDFSQCHLKIGDSDTTWTAANPLAVTQKQGFNLRFIKDWRIIGNAADGFGANAASVIYGGQNFSGNIIGDGNSSNIFLKNLNFYLAGSNNSGVNGVISNCMSLYSSATGGILAQNCQWALGGHDALVSQAVNLIMDGCNFDQNWTPLGTGKAGARCTTFSPNINSNGSGQGTGFFAPGPPYGPILLNNCNWNDVGAWGASEEPEATKLNGANIICRGGFFGDIVGGPVIYPQDFAATTSNNNDPNQILTGYLRFYNNTGYNTNGFARIYDANTGQVSSNFDFEQLWMQNNLVMNVGDPPSPFTGLIRWDVSSYPTPLNVIEAPGTAQNSFKCGQVTGNLFNFQAGVQATSKQIQLFGSSGAGSNQIDTPPASWSGNDPITGVPNVANNTIVTNQVVLPNVGTAPNRSRAGIYPGPGSTLGLNDRPGIATVTANSSGITLTLSDTRWIVAGWVTDPFIPEFSAYNDVIWVGTSAATAVPVQVTAVNNSAKTVTVSAAVTVTSGMQCWPGTASQLWNTCGAVQPTLAFTQVFNFANFSGSPSSINFNGSAGGAGYSGGNILLVAASGHNDGQAWYTTAQNIQQFSSTFVFGFNTGLSVPSSAGIGFKIQESFTLSLNQQGDANLCGIGWFTSVQQIPNQVAVKFDLAPAGNAGNATTWRSGGQPGTVGLYINGGPAGGLVPQDDLQSYGINFYSGHKFQATIVYDGTLLTLTLLDLTSLAQVRKSWPVNIPAVMGANTALVGFGAGQVSNSVPTLYSWNYYTGGGILLPRLVTPTISPVGGAYPSTQTVTLTGPSQIYYTTNGQAPTTASTQYSGPITVSASEYLQAISIAAGSTDSLVATANYVIGGGPTINFPSGFASSGSLVNLVGITTLNGANVQLCPVPPGNVQSGVGAAWYVAPVTISGNWTCNFTFTFANTAGGSQGMCFVIQNQPPALSPPTNTTQSWVSGGITTMANPNPGLGYSGSTGNQVAGILSSVAIRFDQFTGPSFTGLYTNGSDVSVGGSSTSPVNLAAGHTYSVALSYNGTVLSMTLTDTNTSQVFNTSFTVNIPSVVGANTAFVGFTASTGGGAQGAVAVTKWTGF